MIEDSFHKWLNDDLFFLGMLATKPVNGLFTMKERGLISDSDYQKIKNCQIEAYDRAVELSFMDQKRRFLKSLKTAINKRDYYLNELKETKKTLKKSKELNHVLAGRKLFSTISGGQYKAIKKGFEGIISKKLKGAGYSYTRNMSIASTYQYLKWLEDNNPETISINPEYVKFWSQFSKKPVGADNPYLTDEEINDFLNQAFGSAPIKKTFEPEIKKIELRHAANLFLNKFQFDKTRMTQILIDNFPKLFSKDLEAEKKSIRNNLDNGSRVFNLK